MKLFSCRNFKLQVRLSPSQKQKGSNDCGVFAIAVAVAYGLNLDKLHFKQEGMKAHLLNCSTTELFSPFPVV